MTEKGDNLLSLEVPGLAENRPSVLKGDRIYVRVYASSNNPEPEKKEYEGIVHEVENTRILVGFAKDLRKR
jgi:helicase MOV-10